MNLVLTCDMMVSKDYKMRFKAEYYQLETRLTGLKAMLSQWDSGTLDFTPTCDREIYNSQVSAMEKYLEILKQRAKIENIEV